jgi:hypothetical protein
MSDIKINPLVAIQRDLHAPKGQENKFGGYRYRSAEDILEALKPLLAEHNATQTISDEMVEVGGRVYVCATATFHAAGFEAVSVQGWAREAEDRKGMDASQITGASSSYARKYALNGLYAIDDTKDADATNEHGKGKSEPVKDKPASKPAEPAKPKPSPQAVMAQRIEADKEAKWFEIEPFTKGPHKGKTLGDVAAEGDVVAIKQVLDYIDPVALEHETAVKRLKDALTEAEQHRAGDEAKPEGSVKTESKTGAECPF